MKFKYILGAAALISSMVAGAVHAATYNIELTEFGVGDAGADWFGTVELDGSFMLLSASIVTVR